MAPLVRAVPLRQLRVDRGLSLREMAVQANLAPAVVSQIERGRMNASPAELAALSAVLGVKLQNRSLVVMETTQSG